MFSVVVFIFALVLLSAVTSASSFLRLESSSGEIQRLREFEDLTIEVALNESEGLNLTWFGPGGRVLKENDLTAIIEDNNKTRLEVWRLERYKSGNYSLLADDGEMAQWVNVTVIVEVMVLSGILVDCEVPLTVGRESPDSCPAISPQSGDIKWHFNACDVTVTVSGKPHDTFDQCGSIVFHVTQHPEIPNFYQCVTFGFFETPRQEMAYNLFCVLAMYFIPLLVISFAYSRILCVIARRSSETREKQQNPGERFSGRMRLRRSDMSNIERARARTLRMTVTIVAAFIWCWTPYVVMTLWYMFDRESAQKVDSRLQDALFIMAVSNSCMNPLVYGSYATNFRRECKRCFGRTAGGSRRCLSPASTRFLYHGCDTTCSLQSFQTAEANHHCCRLLPLMMTQVLQITPTSCYFPFLMSVFTSC